MQTVLQGCTSPSDLLTHVTQKSWPGAVEILLPGRAPFLPLQATERMNTEVRGDDRDASWTALFFWSKSCASVSTLVFR